MQLTSKISVKTVFGKIPRIKLYELKDGKEIPNGASLPVMRVAGIVRGKKVGEGDNGPWLGFIGQFAATNLETGEQHRSGKCFLPGPATDLLDGAIDGSNGVEFAFDIFAVADDTVAVGYRYVVESLIKPQDNDPISMLLANVAEAAPLQISHKKEAEVETETKAVPASKSKK